MKADTSIFESIVKIENDFTLLTCSLLKYKPFKSLLIQFLFEGNSNFNDNIGYDSFMTQYSIGKYGIPDIAIANSEIEALIEVKINNTSLTINQPDNYLKHLIEEVEESKKKYLFFIIPYNYCHEHKCKSSLGKFSIKLVKHNITARILYWEDLLAMIKKSELHLLNPIIEEYFLLMQNWFSNKEMNFNLNNVNIMFEDALVPQTIEKLVILIGNVKTEFKKSGFVISDESTKDFSTHGFCVTDTDNDRILFFGSWLEFWKDSNFPLIIELLYERDDYIEMFKSFCEGTGLEYIHYKNEYHICIIKKGFFIDNKFNELLAAVLKFTEIINA